MNPEIADKSPLKNPPNTSKSGHINITDEFTQKLLITAIVVEKYRAPGQNVASLGKPKMQSSESWEDSIPYETLSVFVWSEFSEMASTLQEQGTQRAAYSFELQRSPSNHCGKCAGGVSSIRELEPANAFLSGGRLRKMSFFPCFLSSCQSLTSEVRPFSDVFWVW
jgi:hypothetical protein